MSLGEVRKAADYTILDSQLGMNPDYPVSALEFRGLIKDMGTVAVRRHRRLACTEPFSIGAIVFLLSCQ
jgi:hypothetical protein